MAKVNWRRDAMFISEDGYPCVDFTFRNEWAREWMPGGPRYNEDLNRHVTWLDERLFLALSPDTAEHKPLWHVLRCHKKVDREVASLIGRYYTEAGNPQLEIDERLHDWIFEIDSNLCGPDEKRRRMEKFREEYDKNQARSRAEERAAAREEIMTKTIPELQKGKILYSGVGADIS